MKKIDIRFVATFFCLFSVSVALKEEIGGDALNPGLVQRDILGDARDDEYLRNNYGFIWVGTAAIHWNYAVGSAVVTDSRQRLEQLMSPQELQNKVTYSRALTRVINEHVLLGRWDGNYGDGIEPTRWVGSEDILRLWLESVTTLKPEGVKVKYGQCWVFAGLLTTLLRASNIPARTVTNYNSHHDRGLNDAQTAVLRQFDNIVQSDETPWNYHVWTEAWMERPEFPQPYEWNALDATPQEPSPLEPGQPYRAGPAYVPFIRASASLPAVPDYDTFFILAEVNAVGYCPISGTRTPIGTDVVTKKLGTDASVYAFDNPELITDNYKVLPTSIQTSDSAGSIFPPPYTPCQLPGGMRIKSVPASAQVGEGFTITVSEGNVPVEDTVIRMELRSYNGESLGIIRIFKGTRKVDVKESDYQSSLDESSIFRFSVGVYNTSGGFVLHDSLRITLKYNQVKADVVKVGKTITLTLTYTNPLSIPMTGVVVNVAGPSSTYTKNEPNIPAKDPFTTTINVECGTNTDSVVIMPITLDSKETLSALGSARSSCK